MRKYDEGYALPFAVVVMLVLGLVVASILPFSLRNLQNQQASIERMQDKYAAQGEVEKAIAKIVSEISETSIGQSNFNSLDNAKSEINNILKDGENIWTDGCSYTFSQTVSYGSVEIHYTIKLNNVIEHKGNNGTSVFIINEPEITYESYTISYVEATDPTETGEGTL